MMYSLTRFDFSRKNPVELLVVPDNEGSASGYMYWDDGDSLSKLIILLQETVCSKFAFFFQIHMKRATTVWLTSLLDGVGCRAPLTGGDIRRS
jgi:hypothetical protein